MPVYYEARSALQRLRKGMQTVPGYKRTDDDIYGRPVEAFSCEDQQEQAAFLVRTIIGGSSMSDADARAIAERVEVIWGETFIFRFGGINYDLADLRGNWRSLLLRHAPRPVKTMRTWVRVGYKFFDSGLASIEPVQS